MNEMKNIYYKLPGLAFCVGVVFMCCNSYANEEATLGSVLRGSKEASVFDAIFGGKKPKWLSSGSVETPGQKVSMDGKSYTVLSACKAKDCSSEQIAILYDAETVTMYGLIRSVDDRSAIENLTWLNMAGGAETIDGKTILYAALTGSLVNHPNAFKF